MKTKGDQKKHKPKWYEELPTLVERIKKETPPSDIFYYKIDASLLLNKDESQSERK